MAGATSMALLLGLVGLWMLLRLAASLCGCGLAGGVLVRLQELVWAVLPAISLWRGLRRAGVGAAVFTALIAPQVGVWWQWPKEDS